MPTDFSLIPKGLGGWTHQAVEDYAAARCCILNGRFSGFVLAQQAVEKLLKAYLICSRPGTSRWVGKGPGLSPKVLDEVNSGHDLLAHARLVDCDYPAMSIEHQHGDLLERLSRRFQAKYPDEPRQIGSTSGAELDELDELLVGLFLRLPIHANLRWRMGLFSAALPLVHPNYYSDSHGLAQWIATRNRPFAASLAEITAVIQHGVEQHSRHQSAD